MREVQHHPMIHGINRKMLAAKCYAAIFFSAMLVNACRTTNLETPVLVGITTSSFMGLLTITNMLIWSFGWKGVDLVVNDAVQHPELQAVEEMQGRLQWYAPVHLYKTNEVDSDIRAVATAFSSPLTCAPNIIVLNKAKHEELDEGENEEYLRFTMFHELTHCYYKDPLISPVLVALGLVTLAMNGLMLGCHNNFKQVGITAASNILIVATLYCFNPLLYIKVLAESRADYMAYVMSNQQGRDLIKRRSSTAQVGVSCFADTFDVYPMREKFDELDNWLDATEPLLMEDAVDEESGQGKEITAHRRRG
ncbi:MAG: hypothetical protein P1U63_13350 [Coxiellaceae bacterium]|nr:hypothetical protein [Coxiellaceae bacterium]